MAHSIGRRFLLVTLPGLGGAGLAGASRAQRPLPVVGFLNNRTPEQGQYLLSAVREGLKQQGFVEGETVAFDYAWSHGDLARLPGLAEELVRRRVAVIIAGGTSPPAKAATREIPIPVVFTTGLDPVAYGLVESLSRPGGNLTGATFYSGALVGKQLELLAELVPDRAHFGLLVKPDNQSAAPQVAAFREAARTSGRSIEVLGAAVEQEFEPVLAGFARHPKAALIVSVDPYFDSRAEHLTRLAAKYGLPAIYNLQEYVEAGGLISYGANIVEVYRNAGDYAGRILKGAKPSELPVLLPTVFELVINLRTAAAQGIAIPVTLRARADRIVE